MSMSEQREALECPFARHGDDLVNVKFFRGTRNDVITADEIREQASLAAWQLRIESATVSRTAPVSSHPKKNVREFVASL